MMYGLLIEYAILFKFVFIMGVIVLAMLVVSSLLSEKMNDVEKLSAYECGFDPFGDTRHTFEVKFCLIAILFIVFDLEVVFLFPWALTLCSYTSFYVMILFILMLTLGFIFEWRKGALDW